MFIHISIHFPLHYLWFYSTYPNTKYGNIVLLTVYIELYFHTLFSCYFYEGFFSHRRQIYRVELGDIFYVYVSRQENSYNKYIWLSLFTYTVSRNIIGKHCASWIEFLEEMLRYFFSERDDFNEIVQQIHYSGFKLIYIFFHNCISKGTVFYHLID